MRKVLAVVLAAVLVGMFAYSADAQVPNISVYFDEQHTQTATLCREDGAFFDSLFVVANNFGDFAQAVEYQVNYPSSMMWTGDSHEAPLFAGNSRDGIALSYQIPQNAFAQWRIQKAYFIYNCVDCGDANYFPGGLPQSIVVDGYLFSPQPKYVNTGGEEIEVLGMTSLICPGTIGTEETSWGAVKSLYNNE